MNDKSLKARVVDELEWEPSLSAANIGVTVNNGIVQLTGHVPTYAQKIAAETAVKRVTGVRGFAQDLEVRTTAPADSDEAIAGRIANLLDWDVTIPDGVIKVKVDHGMVTLTGQVDWQYQRTAAEQAIRRSQGVRGVNNLVAVKPHAQPADIKRRIEDALGRQAEVESDRIQVTVDGDKVRLEGKVKAWFERDVVERAAWAAPGVRAVEDHVSIGF